MNTDRHRFSRICFVLFVLLCGYITIPAQRSAQGWQWQNPSPQGNPLFSIHFAKDKENGFAVGADNTILHTENGGYSWQRQISPLDVTLSDVFVKDRKNAVIVGTRGAVLTTDNGGNDWRQVRIDSKDHLYGLTFTGEGFGTGWAVGTYGRILKTVDGGQVWTVKTSGTDQHLLKISAYDAEHAVAAGVNGTVLITTDGGETWKSANPCGSALMSGGKIFEHNFGVGCRIRRLCFAERERR